MRHILRYARQWDIADNFYVGCLLFTLSASGIKRASSSTSPQYKMCKIPESFWLGPCNLLLAERDGIWDAKRNIHNRPNSFWPDRGRDNRFLLQHHCRKTRGKARNQANEWWVLGARLLQTCPETSTCFFSACDLGHYDLLDLRSEYPDIRAAMVVLDPAGL